MLKNLINKIYDSIVENINFLFNNNNFKIEKEGEIFIGRTAPITIFEIEKMTKTILLLIKKIEKKSYKTFQKKSETVDEFKINMVILDHDHVVQAHTMVHSYRPYFERLRDASYIQDMDLIRGLEEEME